MSNVNPLSTHPLAYGWRSWLYMILNFPLGLFYFMTLIVGFGISFGLSFIWVGVPLLALAFSTMRRMAKFDRWLAAKFMGIQLTPLDSDVEFRNWNPLHVVGIYLQSATTWQDATYLMTKMIWGSVSFGIAWMVLPLMLFETMLLVFGINTGAIVPKILGGLIPPTEDPLFIKRKNRLEMTDTPPESIYYIDDDGEIGTYERRR
ncbi:MAG: sensor domain-containing protein [Anaerolineae bacterium]|nr:sensor domain-containing protein [Anaerolineae bacterium]